MKRRTITTSVRLTEETYDMIRKEAKEKNVNLNTLINQVLRFETEFAVYARKYGIQAISRSTLKEVLDALDDETIVRVGERSGGRAPRNFVAAKHGEVNLAGLLDFLRMFSIHGQAWNYSESTHGGRTTLVLSHTLGTKHSLFLSAYLAAMFKGIGLAPEISETEISVIAKL